MVIHVLLHTVKTSETRNKNIFGEMLMDVGMEVPKSIETKCSMQAKAGNGMIATWVTPHPYTCK